jgi:hypothetical protein
MPISVAAIVTYLMFLRSKFRILSLLDILKSDSSFGFKFLITLNIASASPVIISRLTGFTGITAMLKFMEGRE